MNILLNSPIEPTILREAETMQALLRESFSQPTHFNLALVLIDEIEVIAFFVMTLGVFYLLRQTKISAKQKIKQERILHSRTLTSKTAILNRLMKGFIQESWREIKHGFILLVSGLVIYWLSTFGHSFLSH